MLIKVTFLTLLVCAMLAIAPHEALAQRKRPRPPASTRSQQTGKTGVIIDETLAVLRDKPSLFAAPIQRLPRGRTVKILDSADADGVRFFRVSALPKTIGWVQADAVFGGFRSGDEERLARLIQAMNGFDQIETATEFFKIFPKSRFKPAILLLFGDLLEDLAGKLSRDAAKRLSRGEMAASGAALHSYFLNYVSLDRYRKLGVIFLFNPATRKFHYNGASWSEVLRENGLTPEAAEARKRLDSLKLKMETAAASGP